MEFNCCNAEFRWFLIVISVFRWFGYNDVFHLWPRWWQMYIMWWRQYIHLDQGIGHNLLPLTYDTSWFSEWFSFFIVLFLLLFKSTGFCYMLFVNACVSIPASILYKVTNLYIWRCYTIKCLIYRCFLHTCPT